MRKLNYQKLLGRVLPQQMMSNIFIKSEDGTYKLSVKLVVENNQQYYMDTASGEITME